MWFIFHENFNMFEVMQYFKLNCEFLGVDFILNTCAWHAHAYYVLHHIDAIKFIVTTY